MAKVLSEVKPVCADIETLDGKLPAAFSFECLATMKGRMNEAEGAFNAVRAKAEEIASRVDWSFDSSCQTLATACKAILTNASGYVMTLKESVICFADLRMKSRDEAACTDEFNILTKNIQLLNDGEPDSGPVEHIATQAARALFQKEGVQANMKKFFSAVRRGLARRAEVEWAGAMRALLPHDAKFAASWKMLGDMCGRTSGVHAMPLNFSTLPSTTEGMSAVSDLKAHCVTLEAKLNKAMQLATLKGSSERSFVGAWLQVTGFRISACHMVLTVASMQSSRLSDGGTWTGAVLPVFVKLQQQMDKFDVFFATSMLPARTSPRIPPH